MVETQVRKPAWLKVRLGQGDRVRRVREAVHGGALHTVCEEALCPNLGCCWEHGRATLMILGGVCSRSCRFCNVAHGSPASCDREEPRRAAQAVAAMGLNEVVLTSVTRDDLPDGGASVWAETIRRIREAVPGIRVEVLIPDFGGSTDAVNVVLNAGPDIVGHNLETVRSLYAQVRPQADYEQSLGVLNWARSRGFVAKTGIMLGLGETEPEIEELMRDALGSGVEILSIGQYLRPTRGHLPVRRYVHPSEFEAYRWKGLRMGFGVVVSGPLVRSSLYSEEQAEYVRHNTAR